MPAIASRTQWWSRYTAEKHISAKNPTLATRHGARNAAHPSSATRHAYAQCRLGIAPNTSVERPYMRAKYGTPSHASTRARFGPSLALACTSMAQPCAWKYQGGAAG